MKTRPPIEVCARAQNLPRERAVRVELKRVLALRAAVSWRPQQLFRCVGELDMDAAVSVDDHASPGGDCLEDVENLPAQMLVRTDELGPEAFEIL